MGYSKCFSRTDSGGNSGRVTVSALADSLALSKGAVSKALNGCCDVSADQGQGRGSGGACPATGRSATPKRSAPGGLILQADKHGGYGFFLAGISKSASAHGWTLTVASTGSHEDCRRLVGQRTLDSYGGSYDFANERGKSHGRQFPENHHSTLTSETVS